MTKFVSHRNILTRDVKEQYAAKFRADTQALIFVDNIQLDNIFNADQTGIPYEIVSNRTLSYCGERSTFGQVQSLNSTKHSYTLLPVISASGVLQDKLTMPARERWLL